MSSSLKSSLLVSNSAATADIPTLVAILFLMGEARFDALIAERNKLELLYFGLTAAEAATFILILLVDPADCLSCEPPLFKPNELVVFAEGVF